MISGSVRPEIIRLQIKEWSMMSSENRFTLFGIMLR